MILPRHLWINTIISLIQKGGRNTDSPLFGQSEVNMLLLLLSFMFEAEQKGQESYENKKPPNLESDGSVTKLTSA